MFRRFFTRRSAMALSVDNWAAVNPTPPSNITIVGVTFFIVTAVVVPLELLRRHHLAELRKNLGAKMDNIGKAWVGSIEEQFAQMRAAQVPGKGVGSK